MKVYDRVIIWVFNHVRETAENPDILFFTKSDIEQAIKELGVEIAAKNVPDIVYTYRSGRSALPESLLLHGHWAIEGRGKGKYALRRLERSPYFDIPTDIAVTTIPDSTPQIVLKYQSSDEQAVLARIRYNRLVDVFASLTTYHLQGHFRTTISEAGQIEVDDLYIGLDEDANASVLPVEAKIDSDKDRLGVFQVTQMVKFAQQQFSELPVRPIGVKLLPDGTLIFLEFTADSDPNQIATKRYKRYQLTRDL